MHLMRRSGCPGRYTEREFPGGQDAGGARGRQGSAVGRARGRDGHGLPAWPRPHPWQPQRGCGSAVPLWNAVVGVILLDRMYGGRAFDAFQTRNEFYHDFMLSDAFVELRPAHVHPSAASCSWLCVALILSKQQGD